MLRAVSLFSVAFVMACRATAPAVPAVPATSSAAPATETRVPFVSVDRGASMRLTWFVPERAGQLTDSQLIALAPRIARLRAEPDTLRMDVVDSLFIGRLVRVLAIADDGAVLGEIRRYGFSFRGTIYPQPSGAVRTSRAGVGIFTATIPNQLDADFRTRGPAVLTIVTTDSTGAGARALEIPKGTGVITGIVRDSLGNPFRGAGVMVTRTIGSEVVTVTRGNADAEGRYRLEGLPAGELTLRATYPRHQMFRLELTLEEGATRTEDITLRAERTRQLPAPGASRPNR